MPVVNIRKEQTDKNDRIASTIRHNRAGGEPNGTGIMSEATKQKMSKTRVGTKKVVGKRQSCGKNGHG